MSRYHPIVVFMLTAALCPAASSLEVFLTAKGSGELLSAAEISTETRAPDFRGLCRSPVARKCLWLRR